MKGLGSAMEDFHAGFCALLNISDVYLIIRTFWVVI